MSQASPADDDSRNDEFDANLQALRHRLDSIDTQLLGLLNARAAVVADVFALKRNHGVQRLDRARTNAILERLTAENAGPLSAADVRALFAPLLKFFVERYSPPEDPSRPTDASGN
jgi:chorismate mutase